MAEEKKDFDLTDEESCLFFNILDSILKKENKHTTTTTYKTLGDFIYWVRSKCSNNNLELEELIKKWYYEYATTKTRDLFEDKYYTVLTNETLAHYKCENIVKKVCRELNITQKELAQKLGVTTSAISQWNNEVPKVAQVALELLIENHNLKQTINDIAKGHIALHKYLAVQNLDS